MTTAILVLAAALTVQSPGAGAGNEPAQTGAGTAEARPEDKIVCKRVSERGTRFTKRVCSTAKQWEQQRRHNVEVTREMQQSNGSAKAGT
ncbi:MAG: hypothetical protein QNJ15_04890 [Erythrobacter sp.]|nr:hypothetical protein [Erythrobacter sp.]